MDIGHAIGLAIFWLVVVPAMLAVLAGLAYLVFMVLAGIVAAVVALFRGAAR